MKGFTSVSLRLCVPAAIALSSASAIPKPLTAAEVAFASQTDMIVIMRDQLDNVAPIRRSMGMRTTAIAASQSSVIGQLQQSRSRKIISFSTINAFGTRMTAAEVTQLASDPRVQAVVPDRVIHSLKRPSNSQPPAGIAAAASASSTSVASELCNTLEPEALQLTNTAFSNPSTEQTQEVLDGNGQKVTGKGVKVAFLADGLDPNIAGFIRPDGSHVFVDYQDFTGDPAGTPTAGGEAFGDASSIAAQDYPGGKPLVFDISKYVNAAHPLPSPCDIHIRGMAPGASLVGLKVFSNFETTTSDFVQAIEYAVVHDDVDVINESFGGNPYPDTENDPTSLANAAAVKAGVTVTVSSGDAGSMGTLGSPSTDPDVISVGATTQYRLYAQVHVGAQSLAHGYASNNISAFSSGGFAQLTPRTVDVVAPGESGWALCSTDPTLYEDCLNENTPAGPTPIEDFGGTSESSPLTAGEAALIIQAYRSTHGGTSPSPALVKRIIMSTATDLGAPASEQGAGLIDSLRAVEVALSVNGGKQHAPAGRGLLIDETAVVVVDQPNTHESKTFKITNTGAYPRSLDAKLQTLGAPLAGATLNLTLTPTTNPTFPGPSGVPHPYIKQKFVVPSDAEHLDVAIAVPTSVNGVLSGTASPLVTVALLDPSGRQVSDSVPQGSGSGYAHVDVVKPAAGTWTAIIWPSTTGPGTYSYSGPVQFTWAAEKFVKYGSVYPERFTIAPGETVSILGDFFTPSAPGDLAAGVRFTDQDGGYRLAEIPVTMRSLVPTGPAGGTFSGVLTGGNGRGAGNVQTYEFNVPRGVHSMSVAVPVSDSGYLLQGVLVDPHGMELSIQVDLDPLGYPQYGLQHFHYNPEPGLWRFLLIQTLVSSGNQTSLPFTGRIGFNTAQYVANGLPNSPSTKLSASAKPVTATIEIVNTGATTEAYFADARLDSLGVSALVQTPFCPYATLPYACSLFSVPSQVNTVIFTAQSNVPITMDAVDFAGFLVGGNNPDIYAKKVSADSVFASLTEPEIPYGPWLISPSLVGPYGSAGAPTEPVTLAAYAVMKAFDTSVSADSGDEWADVVQGTTTYNPLLIPAGEPGTITLTITPDPSKVGQTITGFVYVDTYSSFTGTGDEVVRIPYSYTVAP